MTTIDKELANKSIFRLLISYAGPAVIGLLIHALYNIVDRFFVGRLIGPEGLAGLTLAFPIMIILMGFSILFGSGAATLIARNFGESNHEKAERTLGAMFAGFIPIAAAAILTGIFFTRPILSALGAEGELLELSSRYLRIILMGAPFYSAIAMEFTIRAEGNPKLPAMIITTAAVINMILDPIMILVFHMGVEGTALATVISEGLSAILFFKYYLSGNSRLKIKLTNIRFNREFFIPILCLGFAPFTMDITSSVQNMLTNGLLLRYSGENGVAVMGIVFAVSTIFMMTAFGIGDGMIPIVSFNLGAGNPGRMRQTLRIAAFAVEVLSLTLLLIVELLPAQIAGFFVGNSPEITAAAVTALRIFAISIPLYSFQIIGSRYLQAIHKPGRASLSVFLRQLIIFIPAVFMLSTIFGVNGIWIAFPITDLISAAATWLLIRNQDQVVNKEDKTITIEKKRA